MSFLRRRLECFVSLATVLVCAACAPKTPKLVVWIEVDTLRADALGCYGNKQHGENGVSPSPHLDSLSASGVTFDHAYAPAPWTIPSLVSQISGKWPFEHKTMRLVGTCPEKDVVLVPLLREHGWRTAGVMTNFITTKKFGIARGFEEWDDSFAKGHEGSTSHEAVARLLAFADQLLARPEKGVFLFGWLFEPHYRYEDHEGFRFGPGFGDQKDAPYHGRLTGREDLNALLKDRAQLSEEDIAFLRGRYASEVAWVDDAVGELVAGLKARGVWDDTLLVFTADHGEEIMDRGWIGHAVTLHEELVHVPWIVKMPEGVASERRGKRVSDSVSLIDLPATLVEAMTGDVLGGERNVLSNSQSLMRTIVRGEKPARRWLYLHTDFEPVMDVEVSKEKRARQWGVVDAETRMKWVVDHKIEPGERPRAFLWDLERDPGELVNLAETAEGMELGKGMQRLRGLVPERLEGDDGAKVMGGGDGDVNKR